MKDIFADYQLDRQLDRATSNINRLRETFGLPSDSERLGKFKCAYSGQAPAPPPAETAAPSAETAAPSSRRAISLTPAPTRCAQAGILHVTTYHLCFLGAKARKMTIPYGDITTVGMQVVAAPPRAQPALPPPRGTPRTHRPSPVPLRPGEEGRAEGSLALRGPSHLAQRRTEKQRERHLHGHRGEGRLLENDRRCGQGAGRDARLTPLRLDNYWRAQRSARADMRGERGSTSMDIVGSPAHGAVRARLGRRCGLSKDMSSRGRAAHVVKREKNAVRPTTPRERGNPAPGHVTVARRVPKFRVLRSPPHGQPLRPLGDRRVSRRFRGDGAHHQQPAPTAKRLGSKRKRKQLLLLCGWRRSLTVEGARACPPGEGILASVQALPSLALLSCDGSDAPQWPFGVAQLQCGSAGAAHKRWSWDHKRRAWWGRRHIGSRA